MTAARFDTYGDELNAAWRQHLTLAGPAVPTVVSTFAGAGGSSLGYSMAGYRELLAVEWDNHAAACLRRNFPHVPVYHGDIADLDPAALDLLPGELDVLDGSPPCQGFSTAGRRQIDDPRNQLFREFVRLLRAWRPRAFVMENVSGMGKGKMRHILAEVLAELRGVGYRTAARELVASYYRVPQRRARLIIVGVREDMGVAPGHPAPMSREVTVRQAFAGLEAPGLVDGIGPKKELLAPHIRPGGDASDVLKAGGKKASYFNTCRLAWDRPSPTIVKSAGSVYLHPRHDRRTGTRELARLQSFPDAYDWGSSTYTQIQARLGNSVPPLLMRAIAGHVRDLLGRQLANP